LINASITDRTLTVGNILKLYQKLNTKHQTYDEFGFFRIHHFLVAFFGDLKH